MTEITDYGFIMGAAEVIRVCEANGYAVIRVATPYKSIELVITPKGKRIIINRSPDQTGRIEEEESND